MSDPSSTPTPPPAIPVIPPAMPPEIPPVMPAAGDTSHSGAGGPEKPIPGSLASPGIRLVAVILDGLTLIPVNYILGKIFFPSPNAAALLRGEFGSLEGPGFITKLFVGLLTAAAFVGINWKFLPEGQTIGKKVMKIQIRARQGGLIPVMDLIKKRILPFYGAGAIPGIGVLLVIADGLCIFRPDQNTLHDDLAESKVVHL